MPRTWNKELNFPGKYTDGSKCEFPVSHLDFIKISEDYRDGNVRSGYDETAIQDILDNYNTGSGSGNGPYSNCCPDSFKPTYINDEEFRDFEYNCRGVLCGDNGTEVWGVPQTATTPKECAALCLADTNCAMFRFDIHSHSNGLEKHDDHGTCITYDKDHVYSETTFEATTKPTCEDNNELLRELVPHAELTLTSVGGSKSGIYCQDVLDMFSLLQNEGRLGGHGSGSGELSICDLTHDGTRFKDVCPATCDACEGSGLGSGSDFTDEIKSLLFKSYLSYEPSTSHFFTKKTHGYKQVEHLPFFNQSSMPVNGNRGSDFYQNKCVLHEHGTRDDLGSGSGIDDGHCYFNLIFNV